MGAYTSPYGGSSGISETLGTRGLIDSTEYVRVLEQALRALGYDGVAQQLEAASGIVQQPPQAAAFRSAVLAGDFDGALGLLPAVAADPSSLDKSRFLLLRQKYLEGVARGETAEALQVLRQELQPLQQVTSAVLHGLAALLLRSPGGGSTPSSPTGPPAASSNGSAGAGSPGSAGPASEADMAGGRAVLLDELQGELLPSLLLPERRLEELLEQALLSQLDHQPYHNTCTTHLSLFSDYQAGAEQIPTQPGQVLEEHSSEVWCIAFSPDGLWAASASKDGSALLWAVTPAGRLEGPRPLTRNLSVPCQLVVFSPDSQRVLVASLDGAVRCYDTATARLLQLYAVGEGGQQAVVAVSWFPGSSMFLAATHKALGLWGVGLGGGAPLRRLTPPHAFLYDAAVGPCGDVIITVGQDKRIAFTRLSDGRTEMVPESGTVTSLHLSRCGRWLTTNLTDSSIHLWHLPDLEAWSRQQQQHGGSMVCGASEGVNGACAGSYTGGSGGSSSGDPLDALPLAPLHEFRMGDARPSRYVLRSCVGGARSGFCAAGSEDCQLYIWSSRTGQKLASLESHSGCINAVAWHPHNPFLLASASDDGSIRTWIAPAAQRQQ